MLTISQNIKEDLKKFYAENPNFVFNDQDLLSLNYYFFEVEVINEIYEKGKTIFDLKNLLDSLSLDKIRGHDSIYYNWLNNNILKIDIELFQFRKFIIGQNIRFYRDYFSDYEEVKTTGNNISKIELKAYGRSLKINRSKIAFIGYFENDILVKFDDMTSTANCFRELPKMSSKLYEKHEVLSYYKNDKLLNFLIDNDLTELIPYDKLIEKLEQKIENYKISIKYLEHVILQSKVLNYKNLTVLIENEWEFVNLANTLSDNSKSLREIDDMLSNIKKGIVDKKSDELRNSKSKFKNYLKENYTYFKNSEFYSNYKSGKENYLSVTNIINYIVFDIENWGKKLTSLRLKTTNNELLNIDSAIEKIKNDLMSLSELNIITVKEKNKKMKIRRAIFLLILFGFIIYYFIE
jgi:hypothetical protein